MRPDQDNQYHLFPGTNEQWNDSLRRSDAYHRYLLKKPRDIELGFLELTGRGVAAGALAFYARSIGIIVPPIYP